MRSREQPCGVLVMLMGAQSRMPHTSFGSLDLTMTLPMSLISALLNLGVRHWV
jgi:hypothetical protein